jgi:chemotaxis response regulator CheB
MIKVLMADDSEMMRTAMLRLLQEAPEIQVVGEASDFAETIQMIADFKPKVLVLDLYMPERRALTPAFVKAHLESVDCTVAVSFSNDDEAEELATSYGVFALLDKMRLHSDLVPTIMQCP